MHGVTFKDQYIFFKKYTLVLDSQKAVQSQFHKVIWLYTLEKKQYPSAIILPDKVYQKLRKLKFINETFVSRYLIKPVSVRILSENDLSDFEKEMYGIN